MTGEKHRFANWKPPVIEEGRPTRYQWMVQHVDRFELGSLTDIGAFTYINAKFGVRIESHVQIGSHCAIYSVSTIDGKEGPVLLKHNCRIGSHCVILPGVTVGENSIVGAGSLVNRDIPDNVVAWGTPAKVMKKIKESDES